MVKQCHGYHPWLGMVNIPSIYGDDSGMVYEIGLPRLLLSMVFVGSILIELLMINIDTYL